MKTAESSGAICAASAVTGGPATTFGRKGMMLTVPSGVFSTARRTPSVPPLRPAPSATAPGMRGVPRQMLPSTPLMRHTVNWSSEGFDAVAASTRATPTALLSPTTPGASTDTFSISPDSGEAASSGFVEGDGAACATVLTCGCGVATGEGAGVACVAVCTPVVVVPVGVVEVVGVEVGVGVEVVVGVTVADSVAFEVGAGVAEGEGFAEGTGGGGTRSV